MDLISRYDSPLGGIVLAADGGALIGLWFSGQAHFGAGLRSAEDGDFAGYLELETKYFTAHGGAVPEETLEEIREYGKSL